MNVPRLGLMLVVGIAAGLLVLVLPVWMGGVVAVAAVLTVGYLVSRESTPPQRVAPAPPPLVVPGSVVRPDLAALIDRLSEGVVLLDEEDRVVAANEAAARILGRPRTEMLGLSPMRATRDYVLLEVLREGSGQPREIALGDRTLLVTGAPVEAGGIRSILTLQDVTALRRAERARQELVANISHELRTPITAAYALAETLEGGVEDEAQRLSFHRQLTAEVQRLGSIVDRLLRLSRIESGVEEFQREAVGVADLLTEARRRLLPVAERRSVGIEVVTPTEDVAVYADRERILEVLANLLDNAIRYSPEGRTVRLSASAAGEGRADAGLVRFLVADEGPGILPSERLRVFERFYTGDLARREGAGTGLGLSIARRIVTRHGGEIAILDSARGATLSFTLPRARVEDGPSGVPQDPPGGGDSGPSSGRE